jgi:hypothetical protein
MGRPATACTAHVSRLRRYSQIAQRIWWRSLIEIRVAGCVLLQQGLSYVASPCISSTIQLQPITSLLFSLLRLSLPSAQSGGQAKQDSMYTDKDDNICNIE